MMLSSLLSMLDLALGRKGFILYRVLLESLSEPQGKVKVLPSLLTPSELFPVTREPWEPLSWRGSPH